MTQPTSNKQNTVIIVDDQHELATMLTTIFEYANYNTKFFLNGRQFLDWLHSFNNTPPLADLILLDLNLPDMTGAEIYQEFRQHPFSDHLSVIIFSGNEKIEKRVELMNLGADDYLVKPCAPEELLARVALHIKLKQTRLAQKKAEDTVALQTQSFRAINEIGRQAAQHLDLDKMMNLVTTNIVNSFNCSGCQVFLVNTDSDELNLIASMPPDMPPPANQLHQQAWEQQEFIITESTVSLPIIREQVCLGTLFLTYPQDSTIPPHHLQALQILTNQLGNTVTNAFLFHDIQQRNQQLEQVLADNTRLFRAEKEQRQQIEKIHFLAQNINTTLDTDEVLATATDSLRAVFNVDAGSIVLHDKPNQQLIFASSLAQSPTLQRVRIPDKTGVVGQVIRQGTPLIVNNAPQDKRFSPAIDTFLSYRTKSILCVPLIVHDQIIGAIELVNKVDGPFNENDLRLLRAMAGPVATALENARLYQSQSTLIQQLKISQEQLIQSEKLSATGRLAASLAHEINNPLQAIHSCLQLTLQFNLDADSQKQYLQMAVEEVDRLAELVNRILEFSRPSTSEPKQTNIHHLIQQVLDLTHKYVSYHKWHIKQIFASDIPIIKVIPDQIAQVFLSIILNAFDAMPDSGKLTIQTKLNQDQIEISFQDTGVGMSTKMQENIFDPFYTTKKTASGLGLTISYNIIKQHGGTILVQSSIGQGSTFTVCLPKI
ncbi:MAG TPA: GAF domain-containing protein [Anaerolineae bacterium]|nr:GAF domain-containing protein [Anaerolineae bacterium]